LTHVVCLICVLYNCLPSMSLWQPPVLNSFAVRLLTLYIWTYISPCNTFSLIDLYTNAGNTKPEPLLYWLPGLEPRGYTLWKVLPIIKSWSNAIFTVHVCCCESCEDSTLLATHMPIHIQHSCTRRCACTLPRRVIDWKGIVPFPILSASALSGWTKVVITSGLTYVPTQRAVPLDLGIVCVSILFRSRSTYLHADCWNVACSDRAGYDSLPCRLLSLYGYRLEFSWTPVDVWRAQGHTAIRYVQHFSDLVSQRRTYALQAPALSPFPIHLCTTVGICFFPQEQSTRPLEQMHGHVIGSRR
jgi:hypothetical protein